ncbi:unnamed protein product [Prunus armeniaca]|uniref:Stomatal closure-related actin-binding protein coiled-coil domain-containing protein n=1 Tax=Prunus armeniaca TaxID=36596 RepID=A0A6J5XDI4_PRUAR|nr:unnamed protein product [Prunus armeniaca]
MTRVGRDFGDTMQKDAVPAVSADVIFSSSRFPNYKIGANNQIVEAKDEQKVLSMKEVVARETAQLLEQQKRLSVRDLASKFEKGLAAAAKLSEEARLREAASLEKHVLLKKLRDALESLKGRVAGRNKDDVEDAISMDSFFLCLVHGWISSPLLDDVLYFCSETVRSDKQMCSLDPVFQSPQPPWLIQPRLEFRDLVKISTVLDVAMNWNKVEALAVQLTQREGELMQEKAEVKKLANFLKQASEDAKKLVDEERAFARAEIENARAAVQRVEEALQEQEQMSRASGKQDLEELMKEVQEARRIKMLHQPSKVMDMEHELRALRAQLTEKSKNSVRLQKEIWEEGGGEKSGWEKIWVGEEIWVKKYEKSIMAGEKLVGGVWWYILVFGLSPFVSFIFHSVEGLAMSKRGLEQNSQLYELDGPEALGSYLRIQPCSDDAPELSKCSIQWYRVSSQGGKKELISGAIKSVYAPEPFDVGRILQADIILEGQWLTLTTAGPIDPAAGLGSYVEALVRKHDIEFNVVITQMNGVNHPSESIHVFHVGKMRIKLCKGKTTIAKEYFSTSMQLCGVRGGGNAAAQALFWQAKQGLSFVLAFESERERNAAIMLARRFAFDCNIMLAGPDDRAPLETNGAP